MKTHAPLFHFLKPKTWTFPGLSLSILLIGALLPDATLAQSATRNEISSAYTSLDLEKCHLITRKEQGLPELTEEELGTMGGQWLCRGYNDSVVYVTEGDLRMFVSYGPDAMNEHASRQTLPAFNYVGETLEWRVRKVNGKWVPFATILRWHTESGDMAEQKGEVLIVTKLEAGNTCHVAYIDAQLVPDANKIARAFADEETKDFDCETDDIFYVPS